LVIAKLRADLPASGASPWHNIFMLRSAYRKNDFLAL
jgi:hypothetical protein